jgi:AcrR family transcriptional regulator
MLHVRTAPASASRPDTDLTARARIRDAAIEAFAAEGFDASVRTIATRAGVSAGLITHHFGSKDALHADCDEEVLRRYRAAKRDSIVNQATHLPSVYADLEQYGPLMIYLLRSILVGGQAGREFIEHLMDDARDYMADAVAAGVVRPSRDEEARLRYLTYQSLGAILIEFVLDPQAWSQPSELAIRNLERTSFLPTLELFTEGLLTSSDMLDGYLDFLASRDSGVSFLPDAGVPAGLRGEASGPVGQGAGVPAGLRGGASGPVRQGAAACAGRDGDGAGSPSHASSGKASNTEPGVHDAGHTHTSNPRIPATAGIRPTHE